jgi:hypothetical protein
MEGPDWLYASTTLDTAWIRVIGADPATPLFVGIARTEDAARYLAGIRHDTVIDLAGAAGYRAYPGVRPSSHLPSRGSGRSRAAAPAPARSSGRWRRGPGRWW